MGEKGERVTERENIGEQKDGDGQQRYRGENEKSRTRTKRKKTKKGEREGGKKVRQNITLVFEEKKKKLTNPATVWNGLEEMPSNVV